MKALIDTNILLDMILARQPFFEDAEKIFRLVREERIEGCISVQSLKDIFFLCKKLDKEQDPFDVIQKLSYIFQVIDVSGADSIMALTSDVGDYEDGLLAFSASRNGIKAIITRDKKDFFESDLIVIHPKEIDKYLDSNGSKLERCSSDKNGIRFK